MKIVVDEVYMNYDYTDDDDYSNKSYSGNDTTVPRNQDYTSDISH